MTQRDTSLLAYVGVLENLGERQVQVYRAIRTLKECNNLMISKYLNIPINSVTPRVNELVKLKAIGTSKKEICPYTNRLTYFWKVRRNI